MRTLIPLIILAALAYAGWHYLQSVTDTPLRERLLLTDTETLRELTITANGRRSFRIFRSEEDRWVVKRDALELHSEAFAVIDLIQLLGDLRTDSVVRNFPPEAGAEVALVGPEGQREVLAFRFPAGGPPVVQVEATGDVFALPSSASGPLQRMLRFETYRGKTAVAVLPAEVDSITVSYHDSLLWRVPQTEVPRLSKTFVAPAAAPNGQPAYADYFDEVMDREKYFATLHLHALGGTHRIEVFRDSQWVKPYVLSGDDFPRRYFALDSLR